MLSGFRIYFLSAAYSFSNCTVPVRLIFCLCLKQTMTVLRLDTPAILTDRLRTHMKTCEKNKKNWRRGRPGRQFIALNESLTLAELSRTGALDLVIPFLFRQLRARTVWCVCAQWMRSNSVKPQAAHRDHNCGYGKYVSVLIAIDNSVVDTLLATNDEDPRDMYSANCKILAYDAYHLHAGAAGTNQSKLLINFSIPSLPDYPKIAHHNLHGVKKKYPMLQLDPA